MRGATYGSRPARLECAELHGCPLLPSSPAGYPTASTMGPLRAHRRPGTPPPLRMDRHVARPGASPCRRLAIGLDAGARALMLADRELAH